MKKSLMAFAVALASAAVFAGSPAIEPMASTPLIVAPYICEGCPRHSCEHGGCSPGVLPDPPAATRRDTAQA